MRLMPPGAVIEATYPALLDQDATDVARRRRDASLDMGPALYDSNRDQL